MLWGVSGFSQEKEELLQQNAELRVKLESKVCPKAALWTTAISPFNLTHCLTLHTITDHRVKIFCHLKLEQQLSVPQDWGSS